MNRLRLTYHFLLYAIIALLGGVVFGILGSVQYIKPDFLINILSFEKIRPLHVSLVIAWIILSATGGIYYYLQLELNNTLFSRRLMSTHFILFVVTGLLIFFSLLLGVFGGREYLAFPPLLSILSIIGWIIFGLNYFISVYKKITKWPVYLWMWATGIIAILYTLIETHLWLLPYFRGTIIKDLTVQWKSYGSIVGGWNMLVYGTAIYVMYKIKQEDNIRFSRIAFSLYFLGLTNLMFGWAHHTYIIPASPWIRQIAYVVSMTELIILARIIWTWRNSLNEAQAHRHLLSHRFLHAADIWIFINLILAILISIPFINYFTHGTHITVAHAMGTTIGINTNILLASITFILSHSHPLFEDYKVNIASGINLLQGSLLFFWLALIAMGIRRSVWINSTLNELFSEMHISLQPYMVLFFIAGTMIFISLLVITIPIIKLFISAIRNNYYKS